MSNKQVATALNLAVIFAVAFAVTMGCVALTGLITQVVK
jgi:hypothetical protein